MQPNIGIAAADTKEIAAILNQLLADETVLYIQTRNYHWNVTGPHFASLHAFFESQYDQLSGMIDEVAERVRQLGHVAVGSMSAMLKLNRIADGLPATTSNEMIASLLDNHEAVIRIIRTNIVEVGEKHNDEGTTDFLTGLMKDHEKMAWMLRAHLAQ